MGSLSPSSCRAGSETTSRWTERWTDREEAQVTRDVAKCTGGGDGGWSSGRARDGLPREDRQENGCARD